MPHGPDFGHRGSVRLIVGLSCMPLYRLVISLSFFICVTSAQMNLALTSTESLAQRASTWSYHALEGRTVNSARPPLSRGAIAGIAVTAAAALLSGTLALYCFISEARRRRKRRRIGRNLDADSLGSSGHQDDQDQQTLRTESSVRGLHRSPPLSKKSSLHTYELASARRQRSSIHSSAATSAEAPSPLPLLLPLQQLPSDVLADSSQGGSISSRRAPLRRRPSGASFEVASLPSTREERSSMEAVREATEMHAGGATRAQPGRIESQGGGDKVESAIDAVDLAGTVPRTHERQSDDPRGIPDISTASKHG
ncbi:hypothetical protein C8Q74DRAFT_982575 [Fomes fomentarius]|nr:hypothetical protein C8Q74DRAFT_982575 [Fomes fomentarius]